MSLLFDATDERLEFAAAADLDSHDTWTAIAWVYPTISQAGFLMGKDGAGSGRRRVERQFSANDEFAIRVGRATTNLTYETSNANMTNDKWWFIATTFDVGAAANEVVNVYVGDFSNLATERTYSTQDDGSGAVSDDSANDLIVGNRNNTPRNQAFGGRIGFFGYWDVVLTEAQIQSLQFRLRPTANCLIFNYPGFVGTGTQPDWSGSGHSGTVIGATVADHVPLPPPWGFDRDWQGEFAAALSASDVNRFRSALTPLAHVLMPLADGTIAALDRQQAAWIYSGIAAAAPAGATNRLLMINPPGLDGGLGTGLSL